MVIIALAPVPSTIFLHFTETEFGHRAMKARISQLNQLTKNMLIQDESVIHQLEKERSGTDDLCKYVNKTGCFPIFDDTMVTFFTQGEEKFDAMLKELIESFFVDLL